jgi:hypothetical protein
MRSIIRLLAFATLLAAPAAFADPAFETKAICRTAIAAVMDRDPKQLQATDGPDGDLVLTYARPFDNFVFTYRCKLEDDRVVWADEPGRWRDGPKDPKVSFEIVSPGDRLRITINRTNRPALQQVFDRDLNEVN